MQTESEFNSALKKALELFEYHKTILWWERLQSGKVNTVRGGWVQLCRPNTPDWVVVFYGKTKQILLLFIEGKSDAGIKIIKEGQNEFMNHYNQFNGIRVMRTNSIEEVKSFIEQNSYDPMPVWSKEVDHLMEIIKVVEEEF